MKRLGSLALATLLATGCAATIPAPTVIRDPRFNLPPTDPKSVTIYTSPPTFQYEVIGEVTDRVPASVSMNRIEDSLKDEAAKIGADGVVIVVKDRVTTQKIRRPAVGSQQPIGTSGIPGGGVVTLPTQTGETEDVTIQLHEKEITGVVIRSKK